MTVVCGFVPTAEGRAAVRAAVDEASRRGEDLVVLNTTRGDAPVDPRFATQEDLDELEAMLGESGVPFTLETRGNGPNPAADVVALATKHDASVIVIGLRRRSPTGKLIFGSTAQQILLDADAPVLAVKA
ncbi:universal stress protein [Ornithinimicrobium cerasi]|uniref:Universal stress protein family protein n=1 Tax=Ornithinimicrobium cerasi TaxID=2248773 RepID=A0A285VK56_9MICO|nr:universal stress protein [Ornithinimicrobium cerasi]SOC53576.1 Universal stress protein family protein [Ornithinimicrobium cerasi]